MRSDLPAVASIAGGIVATSTLSVGGAILGFTLYVVGIVFAARAVGDLAESIAAA